MKIMLLMAALTAIFSVAGNAQVTHYSELLPSRSAAPETGNEQESLETILKPCFVETRNGSLPSGFARIVMDESQGQFQGRLESSTFSHMIIENCLVSHVAEFKNRISKESSWVMADVSATCSEKFKSDYHHANNTRCKIEVAISTDRKATNFSEQVESHWKGRKNEANENFNNAAAAFFEILRMPK